MTLLSKKSKKFDRIIHMLTKTTAIELLESSLYIEITTFKKAAQEIVIELAEKMNTKKTPLPKAVIDNITELGKPELIEHLKTMLALESVKLKTLEKTSKAQLVDLIVAISAS